MYSQQNYLLDKFGIDEIYFSKKMSDAFLQKFYHRALLCMDGEDNIVLKYASHDMILVFYKNAPTPSLIYRFLKFFDQYHAKEDFIESNTLLDEEELFSTVKTKNFVLLTSKVLLKEE
jgi:hypothetical protein